MGWIIQEYQWDGEEGHETAIGTPAQTSSWWQALYEYHYKVAFAAISSVPYHTIVLLSSNGDEVMKQQFTPERLQNGGGEE